jgi:hypothetical protein
MTWHTEATQPDARRASAAATAVLQPVRFGEFLRDRRVIDDEQWLAALATHWSERRGSIGRIIAEHGFVSAVEIEREARAFHDLDVVEVDDGSLGDDGEGHTAPGQDVAMIYATRPRPHP